MTSNRRMRGVRNVSKYVRSVGTRRIDGDSGKGSRGGRPSKFYPKRRRS